MSPDWPLCCCSLFLSFKVSRLLLAGSTQIRTMTRTQKNNVTQSNPRKVGPHANFPHCKRSEADEFILVMPVTWAEHGQVRSVLIVTFITNFLFFFLNSKLFTFLINEARRSCEHRRRMQINFFEKIVEFRLKNYLKIRQIFWNKTENVSELTSIGIELKATTEPFVNGQRENRETSARARASCQRIDGHFSSAGG